MQAAARVHLDRRIAEEGMYEIRPHGVVPDDCWPLCNLEPVHAFTMNEAGELRPGWQWSDEVDWSEVAAVKFETPWGIPLNVLEEPDFDGDGS